MTYHGRFAPSPTGPLHFGSLVSAVASHARARSENGLWSVRIENTDHTREFPGAAKEILSQLATLGMISDSPVVVQRERYPAYADVVKDLKERQVAYDCGCTRKDLDASGRYPGICRNGIPAGKTARAVRLRVPDEVIGFNDLRLGALSENVWQQAGDFVLLRADGVYAYQLTVVVDDAELGVTEVVRGVDILDSTPRQCLLQRYLGLPTPRYLHHPVAVHEPGHKLSKSEGAGSICADQPVIALLEAWRFLGQRPLARPPRSVAEFWSHASSAFSVADLPTTNEVVWQGI